MTSAQLNHRIATHTGESLAVIRRLGFQVVSVLDEEPTTEDITLVVHCPFCRNAVAYPGRSSDGSTAMAECDACDIFFDFADRDVFPDSTRATAHSTRRRYIPA